MLPPMVEQPQPPSDEAPSPPRILVVGAGPAGLEAAVALEFSGFSVTVIERGETSVSLCAIGGLSAVHGKPG